MGMAPTRGKVVLQQTVSRSGKESLAEELVTGSLFEWLAMIYTGTIGGVTSR